MVSSLGAGGVFFPGLAVFAQRDNDNSLGVPFGHRGMCLLGIVRNITADRLYALLHSEVATAEQKTEDQIRDQNALDLASVLKRTPGVQISRYNPVGAFGGDQGGAVSIRGQGTGRPGSEIKTYIDDIPMHMATWNHPLLDLLPVNGMQSITVYKGPQPHINGNNFGSINLQTKTATEDGIHGSGRLSGGKDC